MAVTYSGNTPTNSNDARDIGDTGTGSLLIDGGSRETYSGNPFFTVGRTASGDGSVSIDGAGSTLLLDGNGGDTGGHVGSSGSGSMSVTDGAAFVIDNEPTQANVSAGITVGRRDGATGDLQITNASASFSGWGTYFYVGRDGGTGTATLDNATFDMSGERNNNIWVGRNGDADGTLTLQNGTALTMTSGGTSAPDGLYAGGTIQVGRNGTGTLLIDDSTLAMATSVTPAPLLEPGSTGQQPYYDMGANIGREGTGTVTLQNGAVWSIDAPNTEAYTNIGRGVGGDGSVTIDATSAWTMVGGERGAGIRVGREGGTGTLDVDGTLSVSNATGYAALNVGQAGTGTLAVDGTLDITAGEQAAMTIGGFAQVLTPTGLATVPTSGTATVMGAASLDSDGAATFNVGVDGASGLMAVDGGSVSVAARGLEADGFFSSILIGSSLGAQSTSNGTLTLLDGGRFTAALEGGTVDVGANGGNGTLIVDGGDFDLSFNGAGFFGIGTLDGDGTVQISGGGTADMLFADGSSVRIGDGGTGSLSVEGTGSAFTTNGDVRVMSATSSITLADGATLAVDEVSIEDGGVLQTSSAVIDGSVVLKGGLLAADAGAATVIRGDLTWDDSGTTPFNSMGFEIDAAGQNGQVIVEGDFGISGNGSFAISAQNYSMARGDTFDLVTAGGLVEGDPDGSTPIVTVSGQGADFGYALTVENSTLGFEALTDSAGGKAVLNLDSRGAVDASFDYYGALGWGEGGAGESGFLAYNLDVIRGTSGMDEIYVTDAAGIRLEGRGGDDFLSGGDAGAFLLGEDGNDQLEGGAAQDYIYGGAGDDIAYGFAGDDRIRMGDGINYADAGEGDDRVYGGEGSDTFEGGDGIDVLVGAGGGDTLSGGANADYLYGGDGNDQILGGAGDDVASGGAGDDELSGGAGADRLKGREGTDVIFGNDGDDVLFGDEGNDSLYGGDRSDYLYGGRDDDIVSGGAGDDFLRGNRGSDELDGGAGDDDLRGGGQNDLLLGGDGADALFGEGGNDVLDGGADNDSLFGGAGADVFVYAEQFGGSAGYDRIKDFEDGTDLIEIIAIDGATYADIAPLISDVAAGARINFGGGDVLLVEGITAAQLDETDFVFG